MMNMNTTTSSSSSNNTNNLNTDHHDTNTNNLCQVCGLNERKYKCPGCNQSTCSVGCIKQHKQNTGCTGKEIAVFQFIELKNMNDDIYTSDVKFLDKTKRIKHDLVSTSSLLSDGGGQIMTPPNMTSSHPTKIKNINQSKKKPLPKRDRELLKAAKNSNVKLILPPQGLLAREQQGSYYHRKNKLIVWKIDFTILNQHNEIQLVYSLNNVFESCLIRDIIKRVCDENQLNENAYSFSLEQIVPGDVELISLVNVDASLMEYLKGKEIKGNPRIRMVKKNI
jgi:hypothetical protein